MTAQANVDAILAILNAALPVSTAYDLGVVGVKRPPQYVEVTLTRRFGGVPTLDGGLTDTGYRLRVAAISQTSLTSIRSDLETCRTALEFNHLTVGDAQSDQITFETNDDADYGSGWFAEYMAFTYTI
jgi:hypothetical protein